jgi:hypothetical protein
VASQRRVSTVAPEERRWTIINANPERATSRTFAHECPRRLPAIAKREGGLPFLNELTRALARVCSTRCTPSASTSRSPSPRT